MFGFIVANPEKLTAEQNARYKAVYCGLCKALGEDRGFINRATLTYDLAFLIIVLSSVYNEEYKSFFCRCPLHPLKKREVMQSRFTPYAADMNIALSYYKFFDDWQDDSAPSAFINMRLFKKETEKIAKKYPLQCTAIKDCLAELSEIENQNLINPDIPAGVFGSLMASLFAFEDKETQSGLYSFGMSLGKFIYIADAAVDLKKDIKKKHYNPLIRCEKTAIDDILKLLAADCMEKYRQLPLTQDKEIIENILLSGMWSDIVRSSEKTKTKG